MLYHELSFIHVMVLLCYFTLFNMNKLVLWTLMHASRWSKFLPLLAQKFPTSINLFPTPSTQVFPVSHHIYLLIPSMFSMLFVLSMFSNEINYVIYYDGKSWLNSSHELDAHFYYHSTN